MDKVAFRRWLWLVSGLVLVAVIYLYLRPLPSVPLTSKLPAAPATRAAEMPWPAGGQAALGAEGYGLLASHNSSAPVPIGSTAKVITALAVLKQKPLTAGSQGPYITLTSRDVDLFNSYYSQDGSVTQVADGEQITELQALQSMLLPSSNNMADTLAIWAFGSIDSYLSYANKMASQMGLKKTTVGDTNGFSDTTTSTAEDLVKVGLAAISNPALAEVVSQSSAQVPVAGTIRNLNFLLGQNGIIGIKTGNTDKAGGCYLFAAIHNIQGHKITFAGAVLNQPNLVTAINSVPAILKAADSGFQAVTVLHKGQSVGTYRAPWGTASDLIAAKDASLFVWKGAPIKISSRSDAIHPSQAGTAVSQASVSSLGQSVNTSLVLAQGLPGPSPIWRVLR